MLVTATTSRKTVSKSSMSMSTRQAPTSQDAALKGLNPSRCLDPVRSRARPRVPAKLAPGSEQGPVYLLGTGETVETPDGQPCPSFPRRRESRAVPRRRKAPGHHSAKIEAYLCVRIASRGTFSGAPTSPRPVSLCHRRQRRDKPAAKTDPFSPIPERAGGKSTRARSRPEAVTPSILAADLPATLGIYI
jgi:hypothetical protein